MKKRFLQSVFLIAAVCLSLSFACAMDPDKNCKGKKNLSDKFFMKTMFILENSDALALTEEQIQNIKKLKMDTQKELIKKKADIEIIELDIHSGLMEDKIDTKNVGKLVDQKMELKKQKTMTLVESYASLKNILTEEQKKSLKDLFKKCMKNKKEMPCMKSDHKKHE